MSSHYKSARREINTIRLCDIYTRPHNSLLLLEPVCCVRSARLHPLHSIWCMLQSPPAQVTTAHLQAVTANVPSAHSVRFETLKHRLPSQFRDVPANSISLEQGEITFSFPVQRLRSEVRHQRHELQDINKSVTIQIQMEISKLVILITFIFSHVLGKCFQSNQEQLALETQSSGWIWAPCLTDGLWTHQLPFGPKPGTRLPSQKAVCRLQNGSTHGGKELGSLPAAPFPLHSSLHSATQKTAEEGTHLHLHRALGTGPEVSWCIFLALLLGCSKETAISLKALIQGTGDKVLSCQSNACHSLLLSSKKESQRVRTARWQSSVLTGWETSLVRCYEKEGRELSSQCESNTQDTAKHAAEGQGGPVPSRHGRMRRSCSALLEPNGKAMVQS